MLIGTVGYITLNNINKQIEYLFPISIMLGSVLLAYIIKKYYLRNSIVNVVINYDSNSYYDLALVGLILYKFSYLILTTFCDFNSSYIALFISISYLLILKNRIHKNLERIVLYKLLPTLILLNSLLVIKYNITVFILIIFIYIYVFLRFESKFYAISAILFSVKAISVGHFIINDAFHGAEHFLAATYLKNGLFSVFPNIGYLEEVPSLILVKVISFLTNGNSQISIMSARFLLVTLLEVPLLWMIYKNDKLLSILFILALPTDRVSLLIALLYSALIINSYKNNKDKYFLVLTILFPFLCLGLSPSYILIPLLGFLFIHPFKQKNLKYSLIIGISFSLILIFFHTSFIYYLSIYQDFSKIFDVGFSTSMAVLTSRDLIIWPIYLFLVAFIISSNLIINLKNSYSIIKLLFLSFILYKYITYGYGRIDPGFTRLISMGIPLIYLASIYNYKYSLLTKFLLISVIFAYINLSTLGVKFNQFVIPQNIKEELVQLSDSNKTIVEKINKFANGKSVINFSMEPALSRFISNSSVPPFTSPYVTLGNRAQLLVIEYFQNKKHSIIYLGHSFSTFDGIDLRLRTPMIYKYLAENYTYLKLDNNIYAIPNFEHLNHVEHNIFFDEMDLKDSVLYFNKELSHNDSANKVITLECESSRVQSYKIISEKNIIFAKLKCGSNIIPEIFLWGKVLKVIPN